MGEVEELTSYQSPGPGFTAADADGADLPVAFSHQPSERGYSITARVVATGTDYLGRPGNYFAHALITDSPADLGELYAAELWAAPFWREEPIAGQELPLLPAPIERGGLSRQRVTDTVAGLAADYLAVLVTAVGLALAGDRPVLLAGPDSQTNAAWIAAVSFLLGQPLARGLSFTTYTHRPGYGRFHIAGVVPGVPEPLAGRPFHVFDLVAESRPDLPVHPLARLLARAGIMAAEPIWQEASALAGDEPRDFGDWYPFVAAAASLGGITIGDADQSAILSWLRDLQQPPAKAVEILLRLLDRPAGLLGGEGLTELHALACRLRCEAALNRLEPAVVRRARARLAQGERPEAVSLVTETGRVRARQMCLDALSQLPATGLGWLLDWADSAGIPIAGADLADHPALIEPWLIGACRRGSITPTAAFPMIRDARADRGEKLDATLIGTLWPDGCPHSDLMAVISAVALTERGHGVDRWATALVADVLRTGKVHDRIAILLALESDPTARWLLPASVTGKQYGRVVLDVIRREAPPVIAVGDLRVFAAIYGEFPKVRQDLRDQLTRELASLLCQAPDLRAALRGCPAGVRRAFCREVRRRLKLTDPDRASLAGALSSRLPTELVARVFIALAGLADTPGDPVAAELAEVLAEIPGWPGRWRRELRLELGGYAGEFDRWLKEQRQSATATRPHVLARLRRRSVDRGNGGPQ